MMESLDRHNSYSYVNNVRISALNNACAILRSLSLIKDNKLRCDIAEAILENDISKLTKIISSIDEISKGVVR